ncbi:serine/threonine-protein kinase [Streptomyces sp. NPDC012751]|uniref:serine/threonine-protein kinase n=1 Tax=Streptomyces sp. NPDC012751 TaxID=3364846 RepID=UPI0036B80043
MHDLDMVHRDVAPSNVMLTLDGVTLIDFGVARAADQSRLTRTGVVVGTPAYMSPEQASGARRLTGAVDVFALGSVVAYAGCGRPPFGDESGHAVLYRIVHEQPDLDELRALDADLAEVVASCLDKVPESRPTAAELAELAADRAPATEPLWPTAIVDLLRPRAEFAAQVPGCRRHRKRPSPRPRPFPRRPLRDPPRAHPSPRSSWAGATPDGPNGAAVPSCCWSPCRSWPWSEPPPSPYNWCRT